MEIKDIKDKLEKAIIAVATVNSNNTPHNTPIMYAKVKDDKVVITNNYMKTTIDNIKNNPQVSLVFWEGEKGWRIDGKAEHYDSGEWFDFVKSLDENKEFSPRGAIIIEVNEIKELG